MNIAEQQTSLPLVADQQTNPPRIIRLPEVVKRTGLPRASIYHKMAKLSFPKPIALSARSRGWIESEVEAWIDERIRARSTG
jgi:prophage regulatory protein